MTIIPSNPIARVFISASFAFVGFGAWGYLANSEAGHTIALRTALVQGGMSFLLTFVGSSIMEFMVRLSENNFKRFMMAVSANLIAVYGFVLSGHIINGTPNIFLTILPGLIITLIYCISYSWFLTYGHAAGGDFKMVQLLKLNDDSKLLDAEKLLIEMSETDPLQARRIIDDIELGRKSSIYLKDKQQQESILKELSKIGISAKPL